LGQLWKPIRRSRSSWKTEAARKHAIANLQITAEQVFVDVIDCCSKFVEYLGRLCVLDSRHKLLLQSGAATPPWL